MTTRFSLGIDLGTSNSAIAISDIDSERTDIVELTQVLGPNRIGEKPTLPSALYIPIPTSFPKRRSPCPGGPPSAASRSSAILRASMARWFQTA